VKLSGVYRKTGGAPAYGTSQVAREYVRIAPHRWCGEAIGPIPPERESKPDDARSSTCVHEWCGDEQTFRRILVDNPGGLYGFGNNAVISFREKRLSLTRQPPSRPRMCPYVSVKVLWR
jgi:hypothetical protein